MSRLTREIITGALRAALEPHPAVHAMWEGGAVAFGRFDEWSDLDVQVDVDDARAPEILPLVERVLEALSPIEIRYELPQPTWHGHTQAFYRLRDAGPFLLLDLAVLNHSSAHKFLEPEVHGAARVHFDKSGVTRVPPIDRAQFAAVLRGRVESLRATFPLFQSLTLKELARGNTIEAAQFYAGYTVRPLLELLRIRHAPFHYNFHTRYVQYDLPRDIVARLEPLFFVHDAADLAAKRAEAQAWFDELMAGMGDGVAVL